MFHHISIDETPEQTLKNMYSRMTSVKNSLVIVTLYFLEARATENFVCKVSRVKNSMIISEII